MAPKKIIFIIIATVLLLGVMIGAWMLSNMATKKTQSTAKSISVWVVGDTSAQYNAVFAGLKDYAKEYSKMNIDVRVFSDYTQYKRILLSTLADGNGPDIFMVDAGGDDILAGKVDPIPDNYINFKDFEKRYEDIFLPLVTSSGTKDEKKNYIQGVPLGYETLGIFYNKSLLRSIPKTWSEVDLMYSDSNNTNNVYPTNIGLSDRYTPYAGDILTYFLAQNDITSYEKMENGSSSVKNYAQYGYTPLAAQNSDGSTSNQPTTLKDEEKDMDTGKLTTMDLFMRGRIAFLVGYPSLIHDIEKAKKRAGSEAVDAPIFTDRIPQISLGKTTKNIAKYSYLGISKNSKNPLESAKLLEYLMTDNALTSIMDNFPDLITPVRSLYAKQENSSFSKVFARAKLGSFIPEEGEKLTVFHFGLKEQFLNMFSEELERNEKPDTSNILSNISDTIQCELESLQTGTISQKCQKSE